MKKIFLGTEIVLFLFIMILALINFFVVENEIEFFAMSNENTLLNEPMKELNGMSLKEVFEDNNIFVINFTNNATVIKNEGAYYEFKAIDVTLTNAYIRYRVVYNDNHSFYSLVDVKQRSGLGGEMVQLVSPSFSIPVTDNNVYSVKVNYGTYGSLHFLYCSYLNSVGNDNVVKAYIYMLDLTELGLENLTKEELDYLYSLYRLFKDNPTIVSYYKDNLTQEQKDEVGNFAIREFVNFFNSSMNFLGGIGDFAMNFFSFFGKNNFFDGIITKLIKLISGG